MGGNVVLGGSADDPLITTVTYYKGPAAQKVFSVARTTEASDEIYLRVNEHQRSTSDHHRQRNPYGAPEDRRRRRRSPAPRGLHEPAGPAILRRAAESRVDS